MEILRLLSTIALWWETYMGFGPMYNYKLSFCDVFQSWAWSCYLVYTAKIFPLKFRGLGVGIVNYFLHVCWDIGVGFDLFFFYFLPETKGWSLEEMKALFVGIYY
ncbi:hypothetical protein H5410_006346 [Solanum commersonii]|uniref:Uncharacterized protein n=1 Tax=Solanum commersonii TaxID=4109 RepID=A0A9J6A9L8_SOLCO|nr:hypothetical protein H5410_006346 [Solanum commersonii]